MKIIVVFLSIFLMAFSCKNDEPKENDYEINKVGTLHAKLSHIDVSHRHAPFTPPYNYTEFYLIGGMDSNDLPTNKYAQYDTMDGLANIKFMKDKNGADRNSASAIVHYYDEKLYVLGGFHDSSLNAYHYLDILIKNLITNDDTLSASTCDYAAAATVEIDNKLYRIGGYGGLGATGGSIYEHSIPLNGAANGLYTISFGMTYANAVAYNITGGTKEDIVIIGGIKHDGGDVIYLNKVYFYDIENNIFTENTGITLNYARAKTGVVKIGSKAYIFGGENDQGEALDYVEEIDLANKTVKILDPLPLKLKAMGIGVDYENNIMLFGGQDVNGSPTDEVYKITIN